MTDIQYSNLGESSVILNALLAEGEEKVARLVRKGRPTAEAVDKVAADMDLTKSEKSALSSKVAGKGAPAPAVTEAQPAAVPVPDSDCLFFETAEEADQAAGILMYKGIPWRSKDSASKPFIQFESVDTMHAAQDALKRRWDFVESEDRRTAVVEFDNLGDFERVMEYMNKQGMLLSYGGDHELSEDVAVEAAKRSQGKKRGKGKIEEDAPILSKNNSYSALSRGKEAAPVNIWEDTSKRVIKVRKRWR
jgi:hypothetical protein